METTRILLVDDEESLRLTVGANLELEGFEVVDVASAEEALDAVKRQAFDLVLSDIRMPGQSGVELLQSLRAIAPNLPVILMTAFTTEGDVSRAVESGVFTVLSKPFDIDKVVPVLQRALRRPVIVVVDDVESVAVSTAAALESMGVRAIAVKSGTEALDLISQRDVDVCVTDLSMPEMNGIELGRRLREASAHVAVIVFSGAAQAEELMRAAMNEGARLCLRKPLDPPQLARAIADTRNSS